MSSQPWAPPVKPVGIGSVRAARERAEAQKELAQQPRSQQGGQRPYHGFGLPRNPAPSQIPRPQNSDDALRNEQGPPPGIGVAITRPAQTSQWPLGGGTTDSQPYQPPAGRKNAPQRPPRPSYVPSLLDATRTQDYTPSFRIEPSRQRPDMITTSQDYDGDEYDMRSPNSATSRLSTMSSVGSIPDFPSIPVIAPPVPAARRSANLGPPPTSRRGASSYYSNASFVSPIPEESPRSKQSHGSYASSAAIPMSWDSGSVGNSPGLSPGYEYDEAYYDERDLSPIRFQNETIEEGRESRESNFEDNDGRGLIRSASFGRRAKPSVVTTRGPDRQDGSKQESTSQKATEKTQEIAERSERPAWPMPIGMNSTARSSPLASGTGLIDKSSSSSETSIPTLKNTQAEEAPPAAVYNASGANAMLGAYAAASALQPGPTTPLRTPSPGFSRLSAIRRPPKLDIDAVRDAEARGSLTSLPDLIRRATKLAAMMDRGKRPASRLALDDFPSEKELEVMASSDAKHDTTRQSGFSGMLAAFPPPGLAGTPTRSAMSPLEKVSSWPAVSRQSPDTQNSKKNKRKTGRRCCGLSIWCFVFVLILLLLIVAAAVLVPLFFLVWKKKPTTTISPQDKCAQDAATKCQNGGQSFVSAGACACICSNGFTGSTCTSASATACITTTLSTELANVTLGDSIPRLVLAAQTNFSIPLNANTILARFSSSDLSCLSENALVTFNGQSSNAKDAKGATTTSAAPTATAKVKRHDESSALLVDTEASPTPSPTKYSSYPTSTPASSVTSAATAVPTAVFTITNAALDFARVAVLFVLQEETVDKASTAQSSLQTFFNSQTATNKAASNVSLGNGNTINLIDFQLSTGNTVVGKVNNSALARRQIRCSNGRYESGF